MCGGQGPWSLGHWPLVSEFRRPHCYHVNVPGETRIRAVAQGNAAPDRAELQDKIVELLRDVVRGFRLQQVRLAGEQFPFPVYGRPPRKSAMLTRLQRSFLRPYIRQVAPCTGCAARSRRSWPGTSADGSGTRSGCPWPLDR